jgi:CysZ protein
MNFFKELGIGAGTVFKAVGLLKQKRYLKHALVSMIFNVIAYIIIFYLIFYYINPLINSIFPHQISNAWLYYLAKIADYLIKIVTYLIFVVILIFSFNSLFFAIAAPYLDFLVTSVEKNLYNYSVERNGVKGVVKSCYNSFWNGIWLTVKSIFWTLLFFPLTFIIPVVGFLPSTLVLSYYFGLSFLIYSAEHRNYSLKELKKVMRGNKVKTLGMGLVVYFVMFIPFAAIIFVPAGIIAGTMLYNEYIEK